ncbi:beta-N-acetylhexosaminidase [Shewanella sp. Scap07]|uniref:beta-N-acetylhexosaminidase n=1 Tax=Shewanella sp. Scap07 TaxID=2589987 RepID=UPI0015BEC983|nr:beta-N-acetylhexosaminidase [Shewanella sp. Scap07]QLE85910.1 beta-N-acetylhexosaminidase [Shewanella sp. Scap07]
MSYLMMDLLGTEASELELSQLQHPMVGGLILFSRNYQDRQQLCKLIDSVREVAPNILIAVDHEGGRVQRFRQDFTAIPAMGDILPAAQGNIALASEWCVELGYLMAIELLSCDIDLSFAPVLDVNGISEVIGRRAFSQDPAEVTKLADRFIEGMNQAGMAAVGKHFPGHGSVQADSHVAKPVDSRTKAEIEALDMQPFKTLMAQSRLQGVMPAHVIYDQVDPNPAGFSEYWLQTVLRQQLAFDGVIFSDDLGMKGAGVVGGYQQRAQAALNAGCNMILLCNDSQGICELLNEFTWPEPVPENMAARLCSDKAQTATALANEQRWLDAKKLAETIQALKV